MKVYKNKVLTPLPAGGEFAGLIPSEQAVEEGTPYISWQGARIPYRIYLQIVAFFRKVFELHKGESQVRLAYHSRLKVWKVIVLPQEVSGASTKEKEGPERDAILERELAGGWQMNGSWHSHSDFGAFQSGTDKSDEERQNGLHVTIGKLTDKAGVDIHSRLTFRGIEYTADLWNWVDQSPCIPAEGIPDTITLLWHQEMLKCPDTTGINIPKEWLDQVSTFTYSTSTGVATYEDRWKGYDSYSEKGWNTLGEKVEDELEDAIETFAGTLKLLDEETCINLYEKIQELTEIADKKEINAELRCIVSFCFDTIKEFAEKADKEAELEQQELLASPATCPVVDGENMY